MWFQTWPLGPSIWCDSRSEEGQESLQHKINPWTESGVLSTPWWQLEILSALLQVEWYKQETIQAQSQTQEFFPHHSVSWAQWDSWTSHASWCAQLWLPVPGQPAPAPSWRRTPASWEPWLASGPSCRECSGERFQNIHFCYFQQWIQSPPPEVGIIVFT